MKGDFSRDTFDPSKHFSRVLMQQGRVQLDADWNEQNAILLHYLRTLAKDILGAHAGPADPSERGFEIITNKAAKCSDTINNFPIEHNRKEELNTAVRDCGDIVIGAGHYYVEGILVENDQAILYSEQLALPAENQPELDVIRNCNEGLLFYLDVWERHITHVEDAHIREVALGGPDTCSRSQVVWQVKVLFSGSSFWPSSDSPSEEPLKNLNLPPLGTGKLRARAGDRDTTTDQLCTVSPQSRYRGAENQLYRVEIHRGGSARDIGGDSPATFKWSRENGSVTFPIVEIRETTARLEQTVTLEHLGLDRSLGLKPGDWVEYIDDRIAMSAEAGPLVKVKAINGADLTVTLSVAPDMALPCNSRPGQGKNLHPFLRRWDHSGEGCIKGALKLKGEAEAKIGWIDLEDGIQIWFSQEGDYRVRDYWLIPTRVVTGDVEWPDEVNAKGELIRDENQKPIPAAVGPVGPRHYYAPLCLIKPNIEPQDCRRPIGQTGMG
ncbi:DUF6519 domain-containing protein [Nitrosospira briensis]|uniref:DUF6519 domain-containing protein n=1 Tax=Nitrosospira briensis TaxID=35799 RepID=UPI0008EEF8B3|nr:DUF6519 domain-containing protein [Nitrosospira briensis]SFN69659.1 hypothetical protein SAMN05216332_101237 [Nitrosospira briensis]